MKTRIGRMCEDWRRFKLHMTLKDLSENSAYKPTTLSAFEHGKSSNLEIMLAYYNNCWNNAMKREFLRELYDCLD